MKRNQLQLTLALLFTALFLGVLTALSGLGGFLFGNSGAVQALSLVARIAAGLAGLGFLVAAILIVLDAALRPTTRWRKFLYVLPTFFLGIFLAGVLLQVARIGTTGPFAMAWVALGSVLAIVALLATTLLFDLSAPTLKRTATTLGVTGGLSALAGLAMIVVVVLALVTPRTRGNFDPNAQGGQGAPQGQNGGGQGQGTGQGQNGSGQGQFGGGQGQGGGFGQGGPGFEGGPGGRGGGFSTLPLIVGGILIVVFGALDLFFIFRLWRGRASLTSPVDAAILNPGAQVLPAFISLAAITIVFLLVIQVIPTPRDNPPVQTQVVWDSPDTQKLFTNACADCHSNETQRPWYAYIAPGSWLLASHIGAGRNEWNISELNNLPGFRRQQLPNQIAQNLRDNMMPPADYRLMHPEANLTDAEKAQLIAGLQKAIESAP